LKRSAVTFLKLSAMIPLWLSTTTAVVFPTRHTNIWKLNVPRDTTAIGARTVVIKHTNIKKELLQRDTTAVVSRTAVVCGYDRICLEEPRSYPLFYTKPRLTLPSPQPFLSLSIVPKSRSTMRTLTFPFLSVKPLCSTLP